MKYTIEGFSQKELIKKDMDCVDTVLLRYIVDFYNTGKMAKIIYEEKEYFWIKYSEMLKQLPICKIKSTEALGRRLKKWHENGIIEKHTHKEGGSFSCFRFLPGYEYLINTDGPVQKSGPTGSKVGRGPGSKVGRGPGSKVGTKDSSSKRNSSSKKRHETKFPENLNNEDFKKAWGDWIQYKKESKYKLTTISIKKQLNMLSKNPEDAIAIIEKSIINGWKGLFPFDEKGKSSSEKQKLEKLYAEKSKAWDKYLDYYQGLSDADQDKETDRYRDLFEELNYLERKINAASRS
jgi:hypothetical protein